MMILGETERLGLFSPRAATKMAMAAENNEWACAWDASIDSCLPSLILSLIDRADSSSADSFSFKTSSMLGACMRATF
jgi:hypothetical protein